MKKLSAILVFCVLLASCTASEQQRAKSDLDDAVIAAQVKAKIAAVDLATASLVTIDVNHRVVTLTGQVHSRDERSRVDEAARSVSGIARLIDRLSINPKAPTAAEMENDLALQAKVKAALAAQTGVNALKVNVSAHAAIVELEGTYPTQAVHTVILETARGVPGVRRVIDRLRLERA